jgi:nucleoside-diphosphate-sugar epimerase
MMTPALPTAVAARPLEPCTPRKLLDVSRLAQLGWRASIPLPDGVALTLEQVRAQPDLLC